MNRLNLGGKVNTSDGVVRTDQDKDRPVANTDPFHYQGPVLAVPVQEMPMGRSVMAVGSADEADMHAAPLGGTIPSNIPEVDAVSHEAVLGMSTGSVAALLTHEETEHFRTRWSEIQGRFVDEPRSAVQQADALVSEVIEKITAMFANEHSSLEEQWKEGKDVSTENLRQALQHYRSFFNRLVV